MSDPAYDAVFECHGPMLKVDLFELTDHRPDHGSTAAYLCSTCGVWRHAFRRSEVELRELVEMQMPHFIKDLAR